MSFGTFLPKWCFSHFFRRFGVFLLVSGRFGALMAIFESNGAFLDSRCLLAFF